MDIWEATDFFIGHICNRGRLENMKSLRFEEMFVQVRNAGTGFVREVIVSFSDVMCFFFSLFLRRFIPLICQHNNKINENDNSRLIRENLIII